MPVPPIDTAGPTLISLNVPPILDVGSGQQYIGMSATVADDSETFVTGFMIYVDHDLIAYDGSGFDSFSLSTNYIHNGLPAPPRGGPLVASSNPDGTYDITRIVLTDTAGNSRTYDAGQLAALGFATSFAVVSSVGHDTQKPTLSGLALPSVNIVTGAASATFTVITRDVGTGADRVVLHLDKPIFSNGVETSYVTLDQVTERVADQYTLSGTETIGAATAAGTYYVIDATVYDAAGNASFYGYDDLQTLPGHYGDSRFGSFTIASDTPANSINPQLLDLQLPATVIAGHSVDAAFSAGATVAGSSIDHVVLELDHDYQSAAGPTSLVTIGDAADFTDGTAISTIAFDAASYGSSYSIKDVFVYDTTGVVTVYDPAQLQALGLATSFTVLDSRHAASDFNGDGPSDILWRGSDGTLALWISLDHGTNPVEVFTETIGTDWQVADAFDFNGDHQADILWRNGGNGAFTVWNGAHGSFTQNAYVNDSVGTDWSIATTGDLNGDGFGDIVWRQTGTGAFTVWSSTGTGLTPNTYVGQVSPDWQIVGSGDFDGDGKADLLWRNQANGHFTEWQSTGAGFTPNVYVDDTVSRDWHIDAIADFDGDGKDDLLWRNDTTGGFTLWTSTGGGFTPNSYTNDTVGLDWQIAATGDYNGDDKADILWRNTGTGGFTVWQSNGHGFIVNSYVNDDRGAEWHVSGHDYLYG